MVNGFQKLDKVYSDVFEQERLGLRRSSLRLSYIYIYTYNYCIVISLSLYVYIYIHI